MIAHDTLLMTDEQFSDKTYPMEKRTPTDTQPNWTSLATQMMENIFDFARRREKATAYRPHIQRQLLTAACTNTTQTIQIHTGMINEREWGKCMCVRFGLAITSTTSTKRHTKPHNSMKIHICKHGEWVQITKAAHKQPEFCLQKIFAFPFSACCGSEVRSTTHTHAQFQCVGILFCMNFQLKYMLFFATCWRTEPNPCRNQQANVNVQFSWREARRTLLFTFFCNCVVAKYISIGSRTHICEENGKR